MTAVACQGHAGYADEGKDIVCAAVSILAYTCANALESVAGEKPETSEKDGFLSISLPNGGGHDAQIIFQTVIQGLQDLMDAYPSYLQLKEN